MYILDKNKDFYDYFSHLYGEDKAITFDRRGSIICTDDMIVGSERQSKRMWGDKTSTAFRILEVGNVQYIIKIYDIIFLTDYKRQIYSELQSYKMALDHVYRTNTHYFKSPMSIHSLCVEWDYVHKKWVYPTKPVEDDKFTSIELPILRETRLSGILNAEEIWKEMSNYISSLSNDKDADIVVSDIERVINHGFDKKESFRGNR